MNIIITDIENAYRDWCGSALDCFQGLQCMLPEVQNSLITPSTTIPPRPSMETTLPTITTNIPTTTELTTSTQSGPVNKTSTLQQTSKSVKITAGVPMTTTTENTTQPVSSTATLHVETATDTVTVIIFQPDADNSNVNQAKATIAAEQVPGNENIYREIL